MKPLLIINSDGERVLVSAPLNTPPDILARIAAYALEYALSKGSTQEQVDAHLAELQQKTSVDDVTLPPILIQPKGIG